MNSQNLFSSSNNPKQRGHDKNSAAEFTLTYDQYIMLQHYLPKKYALLEYKPGKRNQSGSNLKSGQDDGQNISKLSGNYDNTEQAEGRSKRQKPNKKTDRFLENQIPQKTSKRASLERFNLNLDDEMFQCYNLLQLLRKHKSAYPFNQPVNPQLDGAYNYFDIIKEPMDLSTVEANLKAGEYQTASQFHGDINKIWFNSYAYNQKNTPLYKITIEIQKYYKNLCMNEGISKKVKSQPQKPKNKDSRPAKKQHHDKNQEKQEHLKQSEKKSASEKNQNVFDDSDEFL